MTDFGLSKLNLQQFKLTYRKRSNPNCNANDCLLLLTRPGFTLGLAGLKPGVPWQAGPRISSKKIKILLK